MHGPLNSPWGIIQARIDNIDDAIVIGNFGDGHINVFDKHGFFIGPLRTESNQAVMIEGLWTLENNVPGGDPNQIFFTAGPNDENHGLFGYLAK